jgi:anti-sigma factor RsiW
MNWTCELTEARLGDYLDGLLQSAEQTAFDRHVNACARCTPLVASVSHLLTTLHTLEPVEPSPRFVDSVLTATLGAPSWRNLKGWLRGLSSPRFIYGTLSVAGTLILVLYTSGFSFKKPKLADLSPVAIYHNADRQAHLVYAHGTKFVSDLRVVYEIQSRLRQDNELPTTEEGTLPKSSPKPEPGRTDGTNPSTPRQQNRANGIGRNLEVLATQLTGFNFPVGERRMP